MKKKIYDNRKLMFTSREVKREGIVYVPEEQQQKEALIFVFAPPGLLRVKALIQKYQMTTT